ncbi:MAG: pyridoxal 5'-phosphate synthase glutaminase subunit PdxT [Chloroflexi bacterium]|nr:pyridoxal 5'-phosphate synthase glutaminase subunit PdxT [Chloroflexota bacterium]
MVRPRRRIGVLALQGAFREHIAMLDRLGANGVEVRLPEQLEGLEGLILPGGESTSIGKLAVEYGLVDGIARMAREGRPIWGTCAGMILLAESAGHPDQPLLRLMDISVRRNAFGRQVDSFEADLSIPALGRKAFRGIFIRAPLIEKIGERVEVLARLPEGGVVAVRQGNLLATAFHPELTADTRFHRYFLAIAS